MVRNINIVCDWLSMFTKVSERPYLAFFVKMGKKTRAQQERANDQRRTHRSKARQSVFISEYIQFKYFDMYAEAASFYNALNTTYPNKYDLRKTKEYREWKTAINGETVKGRKLPIPEYLNIENVETMSPRSPTESETTPPQSPTEPETIPPQSPTEAETIPPQSPTEAETIPPQSPTEAETIPPQSPTEAETTPPQSPTESETTPPQSPTEEEKEPPVYNDNLQLRIPLIQYRPETPRPTRPRTPPTVTTETLQIITEEILDHNVIEPTMLDELMPGMIDQIISELRQDPELQNIVAEIEEQIEFEQLGMDIDIPDYDTIENELLLW